MRCLALGFLVITTALAQTVPLRIPADDAAKHLIKRIDPKYPSLAEQARIQGNVVIEVTIDESGSTRDIRLVSGHPMLVTAAMEAVKLWKYEPIQINGKATSVVTDVLVQFGDKKAYAAAGRAVLEFEYSFRSAEEAAEAALDQKDYAGAQEQLNNAKRALDSDKAQHLQYQWRWLTTAGRLKTFQQKYDDAEQYYKNALSLYQDNGADKDSVGIAMSLANLAELCAEEKKLDLARDQALRSFRILDLNFKKVGPGDPGSRQAYGRAAAIELWLLVKLAKERNDTEDLTKQCHNGETYLDFLGPQYRGWVDSACQTKPANAAAKP